MPARTAALPARPRGGPASGRGFPAPAQALWCSAAPAPKRCRTAPSGLLHAEGAPEPSARSWPHGEMDAAFQALAFMAGGMPAHDIATGFELARRHRDQPAADLDRFAV